MASLALAFDILARDRNASRTFENIGDSAETAGKKGSGFGDSIKKAAGLAAGALVAAGIGKLFTDTIGDAVQLDTKMREVVTLFGETGPAAEASLGQVKTQVKDLSNEFGVAQETLTGGLYQAISAGVPRDNALEFMRVASQAAIGGVTDTETAVDGLSTVINAFGLEASDAQAVSDSLFTAVKGGKTDFKQLSDSLFNVAPAAAAAGVGFDEVNAAVATLTAGGTPTSVATTQIRAALTGLQKPSKDLDAIFQDLGYNNAQLAIESEGLGFALDAVKDASKGNNGELQRLLGSSEAVAAANVLAGTGAEKFAQELKNQKDAAGATADAFDVVNDSAQRQWEIFKERLRNGALGVAQAVLPSLNSVLTWVNDNLGPGLAKIGDAFSTLFGGEGDAAYGFAEILDNVFGNTGRFIDPIMAVGDAILTAKDTVTGLFDAFNANGGPSRIRGIFEQVADFITGRVVPAVSGLATAFQGYLTTVLPIVQTVASMIVEKLGPLVPQVLDFFSTIADYVVTYMGVVRGVISTVTSVIAAIWSRWGDRIMAFVSAALDTVVGVIGGALDIISGIIKTVTAIMKGDWSAAWDGIKQIARGAWGIIRSIVSGAIETMRVVLQAGLDGARSAVSAAWERISGAVSSGVSDAVGFVRSLPEKAADALGDLGDYLKGKGRALVQGLIDGISEKIQDVRDKAAEVAGAVRGFFPGSPVKEGPLREHGWNEGRPGKLLAQSVADGLLSSRSVVRSASAKMAGAVQAPTASATSIAPAGLGGFADPWAQAEAMAEVLQRTPLYVGVREVAPAVGLRQNRKKAL